MIFRIRRTADGLYALESQELDATNKPYWRWHGEFVEQATAVTYASAVKSAVDAKAVYEADVAAGRDIVQTITL